MKKRAALFLSILLLFSTALPVGAATIGQEEWKTYFETNADVNRGIMMQPGADETRRNFTWYMPKDTKTFSVSVSTDADMKDAVLYSGVAKPDPDGGLVAKVTVDGLKADTTYYYTCNTETEKSEVYTFTTLKNDSFTALYVTDIHISDGSGSGSGGDQPPKKPGGEGGGPGSGGDQPPPKPGGEGGGPGSGGDQPPQKPGGDQPPQKPDGEGGDPGKRNDVKENGRTWANVLDQAYTNAHGLDLILSAGDQAGNGKKTEYLSLVANRLGKSIPFAVTVGNHDAGSEAFSAFIHAPNRDDPVFKTNAVDDYWFVKGDSLFLVMDSNSFDGKAHDAVTARAIEQNPDVKWRILMMHHEIYSEVMSDRVEEQRRSREFWSKYADKYGIDVVLSGHSHFFSISNVMSGNRIVAPVTGNCTLSNPKGTVYLCSGSICSPRNKTDPPFSDFIGFGPKPHDGIYYNLIDFSKDKLTVTSWDYKTNQAFNTLTIEKDDLPAEHRLNGDVSCDGVVSPEDARLALRAAVGLEYYAPGSVQFLAADYDKDMQITPADARLILRVSVGLPV